MKYSNSSRYLFEDADRRVAGRVAHAADRRAVVGCEIAYRLLDVLGPALAGDDAVDDPVHPAHAFAARRALAAGLVVVEAQQHLQQAHHAGALGDDDHAARAERRAGRARATRGRRSAARSRRAVSTLVEMPPGMMHLSCAPPSMPPQSS